MRIQEKVLPMNQLFRRIAGLFIVGFLAVILVSTCTRSVDHSARSPEITADCRVIQHTMGESCIPLDPQRIIVLSGDTMLGNLLAMDIKPIAASSGWEAVEPFPEHLQNQLAGVEYVGTPTRPSLAKVLSLQPDLILANHHMEAFYDQLSQIAPIFFIDSDETWKERLIALSKILDKEDVANRLMDNYQQRIGELQQALGDNLSNLIVSVATMTESRGIWAYSSKYSTGIVLEDVGVQRPLEQIGNFNYTEVISVEKLDAIDGDVLFFVNRRSEDDNNAISEMQESPLWQQLNVVQNDRVYPVSLDHWYLEHSILGINAVLDDLFENLINSP